MRKMIFILDSRTRVGGDRFSGAFTVGSSTNGLIRFDGAVDWQIVEPLKLSVNFVNVLLQNGPKGSIDVADTITDASPLNNHVMSGSYIRPFTVDFMLT